MEELLAAIYYFDYKLGMTFEEYWKKHHPELSETLAFHQFYIEGEGYENSCKRWKEKYGFDFSHRCKAAQAKLRDSRNNR